MRVVAINGSPNGARGNTALILNPFLDGMREAGAEVELFGIKYGNTERDNCLEIRPCRGCLFCLESGTGECPQRDGMQTFYEKMKEADIWVLASPVHADGVTGPMMNLMSRTLALLRAPMQIINGRCRYGLQEGVKTGRLCLVSNCGFHELENFLPMLAHVRAYAENVHREFAGALLRPHGPLMQTEWIPGRKMVLEAAWRAGWDLITNGRIDENDLDAVSAPLIPKCLYAYSANFGFDLKAYKMNK